MTEHTDIEYLPTNDLIPYDRNPKYHPDTQINQIANSIRQWGFTQPILIDENNVVIAGHGRLYAAERVGLNKVPCRRMVGWSDDQKKAYVIADNKLAENGEWDTSKYISELRELNIKGFDFNLMGIDIDMSKFDYQPILDPSANHVNINEKDLIRADSKISNDIQGLHKERGDGAVEVMCPHCGEEFKVAGY